MLDIEKAILAIVLGIILIFTGYLVMDNSRYITMETYEEEEVVVIKLGDNKEIKSPKEVIYDGKKYVPSESRSEGIISSIFGGED